VILRAGCALEINDPKPCPIVAMLRPRSGDAQWLVSETYQFSPRVRATEYVDEFGNLCQRFVAPAGALEIMTEFTVHTESSIAVDAGAVPTPIQNLPHDTLRFLLPSRYCPSDKLGDVATRITSKCSPGYPQVDAICNWIRAHIEYKYGVSSCSTDAAETLQDRAGVCRDFAHLGITLTRCLKIPARMVVGYLHRLDPMDLHAWFEAFIGGRWFVFDPTQGGHRGGRIVVAYGRDATDVAFLSNYGELQVRSLHVWVDEESDVDASVGSPEV
jgi:transglutaminase-like putative cysteine protease